ncbi:MAG: Smr/MutS family protein [Betaproteobacteria bacterium]
MKKPGPTRAPAKAKADTRSANSFGDLVPMVRQLREAKRAELERARQQAEAERRAAREASLFRNEVAEAVPLADSGRIVVRTERPPPLPRQRERDERAVLDESLSDDIDIERFLDTDDALSWRRPGIGADVVRRLRRGEWTVRSQIDLHGLRVDEARAALVGFLNEAIRSEMRCLRIIHGKGLGSPSREPVLKNKVRKWLAQRAEVLAFCQARPNDGGGGALIVLLQAPRSRPGATHQV